MEDVVLALHRHVADVPAVGRGRVGRHLAGRAVMIEHRVSSAAGVWKALAVLLHEKCLRRSVRHIDDERGFGALLEGPLELRGLGAFRERLAVARTPALYDLIMIGFPTMTLSSLSVRAEEITDQSSYPLKSEKATPLGDVSECLSCA